METKFLYFVFWTCNFLYGGTPNLSMFGRVVLRKRLSMCYFLQINTCIMPDNI